jgi:hypothetical protein
MRKEIITSIVAITILVVLVSMFPGGRQKAAHAILPTAGDIRQGGFTGGQDIAVTTTAAVQAPALPGNCTTFIGKALEHDVNYGDSTVGYGTEPLYIPAGEARQFGPFNTPNPTVYFRIRNIGSGPGVLRVDPGCAVEKTY